MTLADSEVGRRSGKWVNGRRECSFPLALFLLESPPRLSFFMYIRNGTYSTRMQHDHRSMLETGKNGVHKGGMYELSIR